MTSKNKWARQAGLLYLILILGGIFSLMYVPSRLIDWEDASMTFQNISDSTFLFKLGIITEVFAFLAFLFLSLVLYKLLYEIDRAQAKLMVVLVLVSIPISFFNMVPKFSVLNLLSQPTYLQGFTAEQLQGQLMLLLANYNSGLQVSYIFWGLWLFPFGYLVFKSGFLPKILGILLMAGCFFHLADFSGNLLLPNYHQTIIPTLVGIPSALGEFAICLWLLIMGTNKLRTGEKLRFQRENMVH